MAEAWVATFKTELVDGRRFPSFEHAEHEMLHWIGFYNDERLHEALDDVPPAEYEQMNIKTDNTAIVAATPPSLQQTQGASIYGNDAAESLPWHEFHIKPLVTSHARDPRLSLGTLVGVGWSDLSVKGRSFVDRVRGSDGLQLQGVRVPRHRADPAAWCRIPTCAESMSFAVRASLELADGRAGACLGCDPEQRLGATRPLSRPHRVGTVRRRRLPGLKARFLMQSSRPGSAPRSGSGRRVLVARTARGNCLSVSRTHAHIPGDYDRLRRRSRWR